MEDLCRTCGEIPKNSGVRNLFGDSQEVLLQDLRMFTGCLLENEERLPVYICSRCQEVVEKMVKFRDRCTLVQRYLKYKKNKVLSKRVQRKTEPTEVIAGSYTYALSAYETVVQKIDFEEIENSSNVNDEDILCDSIDEETITEELDTNNKSIENSFDEGQIEGASVQAACLKEARNINDCTVVTQTSQKKWRKDCICEFCGKKFTCTTNLKQHQYIHSGVKNFHCTGCNAKFYTEYLLKKHERIHSDNHPYVCRFCPAKFSYPNSKVIHERIHTNERPYKCRFCEKAFTNSGSLKEHISTHTRERKYYCEICNHRALTNKQLKTHCRSKAHKQMEQKKILDGKIFQIT